LKEEKNEKQKIHSTGQKNIYIKLVATANNSIYGRLRLIIEDFVGVNFRNDIIILKTK